METNEQAQRERYREVERALGKLVEEIEEVEDGAVKELEQKIYKGVLEIGRKLFQCRINKGGETAPGKQRGECGHEQHLVDYRTKQILTIMGKVEFKRAYSQCQREKEEEELVASLAALPPIAPEPGESRSVPAKAIDYFSTNAERMRYPAFRAQGMHVGSGIAEAACQGVVATRLKRSGMRWTPDGLDALLPLRTSVLNHTYDDFWQGQLRLVA